MIINLNKCAIIVGILLVNFSYADVARNGVSQEGDRSADLDQIHDDLTHFLQTDDKNNLLYQEKLREMLHSVEERFSSCDSDNDNTLDVYETTQCLPQIARQFRKVDIDKDNVISLDEISIMARDFIEKRKKIEANIGKDEKTSTNVTSTKKGLTKEHPPL